MAAVSAASGLQVPPPATAPPATPRPGTEKPPLDFTGVWVLDENASRNVSPPMHDAVLNVRQTGNQIWIAPMDPAKSHLLSESIVVDGRPYVKTLGNRGKGILTAAWGRDRKSLWLEVTAGPEENPREVVQRSEWTLSPDRRTWTRQSVSLQKGKRYQSMLVFHRQLPGRTPTHRPAG